MEVLSEYRTVKFQQDRYKIVLGNLKTYFNCSRSQNMFDYIITPHSMSSTISILIKQVHNPITWIAIKKKDNKMDFTSAVQAFQKISDPTRLHQNLAQPADLKGEKGWKEGVRHKVWRVWYFYNTIIKINGLRHKMENKEMSMKEQIKDIDNR